MIPFNAIWGLCWCIYIYVYIFSFFWVGRWGGKKPRQSIMIGPLDSMNRFGGHCFA